MKISQEDEILIKKSICQSSMVHEGCCMIFRTGIGKLKESTVC